jgi:PDZ domain-containing protein
MSRRSLASLLALGLLLVLVVQGARMPVPYVTVSPGPTIDVLGKNGDDEIVQVDGTRTYATDGELRLTTVSVTNPDNRLNLLEALAAWMRSDVSVMPYAAMYPRSRSTEEERAESAAEMVSSQDTAVAAALGLLGHDLPTYAEVVGVSPNGPSEGTLKVRDRVERVAGTRTASVRDVLAALDDVEPGDTVQVEVRRVGVPRTLEVTTVPGVEDPERATLGIVVGTGFEFPFQVSVGIDDSIGGPSAGLMFALAVYDTLTPGSLTNGDVVAGTGSISAAGEVGPIGGIQQKIAGAADSGAELFFVPPVNCAAATAGDAGDDIRLVRADSLRSAVRSLETYAADPSADLPRCPS